MQRIIFAALVGLSLAIGLTVGTVAWRTASFDRTMPDLGAADPSIGYAFYAGIDQVLTGGDATALERVVTGDFVDHASDAATDRSRDELVAQLSAFGTSFPGTQIQVTDIQASATSLVAAIAPITMGPVPLAGMTLTAHPSIGGYEVLRIRNGKVSERWTTGLPDLSADTFDAVSYKVSASANVATRLDRITLPKGSEFAWKAGGSGLLIVESGSVRSTIESTVRTHESERTTANYEAGAVAGTPAGSQVRLAGDGDEPAQLLLYSTRRVTPVDAPPPTLTGGSTIELLWASNLPLETSGSWQVSIGRVGLPPDEAADLSLPEGATLLLYGEGGSLEAMTPGGTVKTLDESFLEASEGNASTIDAGIAANISNANRISLRSGPNTTVTAWLITIVPSGSVATPVA